MTMKKSTKTKLRTFIMVVLAALPATALAGPRDDVVDVLVKCTDVAGGVARLDCYDRLAPQLKAAARTPPGVDKATQTGGQTSSSNAQPPSGQAAAPQQESSFLGSLNPFGGGAPESAPSARQMAYQPMGQEILPVAIGVADYTVAPSGAFTVTLDNGQVWREHNGNFATPPFKPDGKNIVIIEHGLFGSYNLTLKGNYGKLFKVVRVK